MHSPTNETDSILAEAARLVAVDRDADYGDPVVNHERIAALWSAYLGVTIGAREASIMAALVKLSREANKSKRDNLVDAAAYLEIASRCRREDEERITLIGCREQTYGVTPSDPSSNGAAKVDAIDEIRMVLEATLDESTVDAAKRIIAGLSNARERLEAVTVHRDDCVFQLNSIRRTLCKKPHEQPIIAARRIMEEHAAMSVALKARELGLSMPIEHEMLRRFMYPAQRTESVAGGCAEWAGETASNETPAPPYGELRKLVEQLRDACNAADVNRNGYWRFDREDQWAKDMAPQCRAVRKLFDFIEREAR